MDITIGLPNTVAGVTRDSLLEWSRRAEARGFPGVASLDRLVYAGYEPLVALAAVANLGLGLPWIVARAADVGAGTVTAVTYEYGNCFMIVAGLLNFLVVLDAFDIAMGRK
jgi:hypothetical protein